MPEWCLRENSTYLPIAVPTPYSEGFCAILSGSALGAGYRSSQGPRIVAAPLCAGASNRVGSTLKISDLEIENPSSDFLRRGRSVEFCEVLLGLSPQRRGILQNLLALRGELHRFGPTI